MSNPTQYAIEYTKKFETGTLAGLTVPCRITFGTRDAARRYLPTSALFVGYQGSDAVTGNVYRIVAVDVVAVEQSKACLQDDHQDCSGGSCTCGCHDGSTTNPGDVLAGLNFTNPNLGPTPYARQGRK